jgi:hypothetical protein
MDTNLNFNTRVGTLGGVAFVVLLQLGEVVKTMALAGIGAAVSFGVSMGLKWVVERVRRRRRMRLRLRLRG